MNRTPGEHMIDGKPAAEWFNDAAQRQGRDNQFATYDRPSVQHPGTGEKGKGDTSWEADKDGKVKVKSPPAEVESKKENAGESEASEKAPGKSKPVKALQEARAPAIAAAKSATKAPSKIHFEEQSKAKDEANHTVANAIYKSIPENPHELNGKPYVSPLAKDSRVKTLADAAKASAEWKKKQANAKTADRARRLFTAPSKSPYAGARLGV